MFVVHYEDGIRFVSGTERLYERGSTRALHLRQRNQNREQVQTQGVLHLHLKQRLWIKCLGWQKSGVNFPGILPRVKHCVREVEWTFVVDIGFQRAFVGSMFEVDHTSSPGSQGFSMQYNAVAVCLIGNGFRMFFGFWMLLDAFGCFWNMSW